MFHWGDDRQPVINNLKPVCDFGTILFFQTSFAQRHVRFRNEYENGSERARSVQIIIQ